MSLINDALKRAKQAHQESPASAVRAPDLRPVEPPQQETNPRPGLLIPAGLAIVAVAGLLLFWVLWNKQSPSAPEPPATITASARTPSEPLKAPVSSEQPEHADNSTVVVSPSAHKEPPPALTEAPGPGTNLTGFNAGEASPTNRSAPSEAAVPLSPPPLKLQSIVFNPRRPSALINGRVLFIGDRIRDLRVKVIHRDEVVLVGGGTTNVLSLEP
jgi:hypothetical protein